ncbi:MAG: transporter substrate-binding domain-containing protein [Anaerolineaceae bacterium]|nr:transporter substrate-binding domain-containing protein [Anaerolineaceae bacterium]
MKKMLSVVLALAIVASLSVAAFADLDSVKKAGVLTFATSPDFSPMEFVDSTKDGQDAYVGYDVTFAKYIAEYIGVELEIQPMSFDACQTAVAMGAVDLSISGYAPTETRKENFELSDPYHATLLDKGQMLLVKASDVEKFQTADDFTGKTVGAQNSSLQMELLTSQLPDAVPYPIGELGVGVMELQSGNIDALCVAEGNGKQIIANNPDLAFAGWAFEYDSVGNVVLIQKGNTSLCEAVNEAIAIIEAEGLNEVWYKEAKEIAAGEGALEVSFEDAPAE